MAENSKRIPSAIEAECLMSIVDAYWHYSEQVVWFDALTVVVLDWYYHSPVER